MQNSAPHTVAQTSAISSDDVNQFLDIHSSVITWQGTQYSYINSLNNQSTGYIQLPSSNIQAYSQQFATVGTSTVVSSVQIPISVPALDTADTFAKGVDFSAGCDITVSIQNASGGLPTGNVSSTSSIKIPAEVLQAISSSNWPEPQSAVPGEYSVTPNFGALPLALTSSVVTADTTGSSTPGGFTLPLVSSAAFPASNTTPGTFFIITPSGGFIPFAYGGKTISTAITANTSNTVLIPAHSVAFYLPTTFAYLTAGNYILAANLTQTDFNYVYVAPYLGNGVLGQWLQGEALPEYDCSITYSPSSKTFFAIGPSGAYYQASFDETTGVLGAWQSVQGVTSTLVWNKLSSDKPPAMCVATIDSKDFLIVLGGISSGYYYGVDIYSIDSSGTLTYFGPGQQLFRPCFQSKGTECFVTNNTVYVRDTSRTDGTIDIFSAPVWFDDNGNFHMGSWSFCSHISYGQYLYGAVFSNVVTRNGIVGLSPNGYGSDVSSNSAPTMPFPDWDTVNPAGSSFYFDAPYGVLFENDDGSASLITTSGLVAEIYKVIWVTIPMSCTLNALTNYCLVVETSLPQNTNYGVNIMTTKNSGTVTYPAYAYKNQYGWNSGTSSSMIPIILYDNNGHLPLGIIEENGKRWSYLWYDNPNHLLISAIEVAWDSSFSDATSFAAALYYDGIGGKNNLTKPTLINIVEIF